MAGTRADEYRALCITVPRQPKRGEKKKSSGCDGHTMNSNRSLLHQLRRCIRVRVCVYVGGTHNAIYACEGDRSIDDNRWRRTKNRGGGKGRRYGRVVERQGRRDGGGGVVSKIRRKRFLSLPLSIYPVSIPFRRRGTEMEVGRRNHQVDLG